MKFPKVLLRALRTLGTLGTLGALNTPWTLRTPSALLFLSSLLIPSLLYPTFAYAPPNSLIIRLQGDPETLDWNRAHTPVENYLMISLMEGLVSLNSVELKPALAQKWKISGDRKTYTFYLRKDARWSDGVPLKAEDFVTSWKRLLDPKTGAAYAYFLFDIEGAEEFNSGTLKDFSKVAIQALDSGTLRVKLKRPVSHWLSIPTHWVTFPMRQDQLDQHGDHFTQPGKMVTTGPFVLSSYEINSQIVLKKNPYYYDKGVKIESIIGKIVADDTTALQLYQTGNLDFMTDFPVLDVKAMARDPGFKTFPYLKTVYLGFSLFPQRGKLSTEKNRTAHDWISNPHFRKAIGMSIDRSKIGEILQGQQTGAGSFVPPPLQGHNKNIGLIYDPKEAKAEYTKSGAPVGLELELLILNWEKTLTLAQYLQSQLHKNLGINLKLQPFDNKTYRAQLDSHRFPLFITSWSADYVDPDNFLSIFLTHSGNNRTGWHEDHFDHKIIEARQMPSSPKRERIYFDLQREIEEENPVIVPLYYEPNIALVNPRVHGLKLNPLNYLDLKGVGISEK